MKNILNVSKISFKPILMSLLIFSATLPVLPSSLETLTEASSDDPWPEGDPFASDDDANVDNALGNVENAESTSTTACQCTYGIDTEKFDVPEIPKEMNGYPLTDVKLNTLPNNSTFFQAIYGNEDVFGPTVFLMPKGTSISENACSDDSSNVRENANFDDFSSLDSNHRRKSFWQTCCSCCLKNHNKKND